MRKLVRHDCAAAWHRLLAGSAGALMAAAVGADDWTQYRGSNHDGISAERIRTNWTAAPPRRLWRVSLGPALSSLSTAGGRAFTQVRRAIAGLDQEVCIALNADTGAELWATPVDIADYPDDGVGPDEGPRSTPSLDGTNLFVLSTYLKLFCLDAATGSVIWKRDLLNDFGGTIIPWQNAASPLIVENLIYVNCNAAGQALLALQKTDGSVAWKGQSDMMTQATPVAATIAGTTQVVFFAQSGLVSVHPLTGSVLWRYSFPFAVSTAASPVVAGDVVYCSAAYGVGAGAARILKRSGGGLTALPYWRTDHANMNHWATPVFHDGYFYGVYGESLTRLACLSATNGALQWGVSGVGLGGVLMVAGLILVSTDDGQLVLVQPDPTVYTEVDRFQAVAGKCWNTPAISNGRIYCRSTLEAAAFDVATTPWPRLELNLQYSGNGNGFSLLLAAQDSSPLNAAQAAKIDVLVTSDLSPGGAGWTKLATAGVLTNGQLRLDDPAGATNSQRFYKAQARP